MTCSCYHLMQSLPSVLQDQLREGVASLRAFSDKVQTVINELEETCRHIEVCDVSDNQ